MFFLQGLTHSLSRTSSFFLKRSAVQTQTTIPKRITYRGKRTIHSQKHRNPLRVPSSARTRCLQHTYTHTLSHLPQTNERARARAHTNTHTHTHNELESLMTSPTQLNATAGVSPTSWRFKGPEYGVWHECCSDANKYSFSHYCYTF